MPTMPRLSFSLAALGFCAVAGAGSPARADDQPSSSPSAALAALIPNADLAGLDEGQLRWLRELLDQYPSACGKSHSLATSLAKDASCRRSQYAGRYLAKLIKLGLMKSECEEHYEKRFVSPETAKCDLSAAPLRGSARAAVKICEFSDFECPHCRVLGALLDRLVGELPGKLAVYFKHFPLGRLHADSAAAAVAAVAADRQGKFWQMHDLLFKSQGHLTPIDLERHAAELKLDVKKWKADLTAAEAHVAKDRAEGERLDIQGTPTVFINGRKYTGPLRYEDLKDWIEEELAK